MTHRHVLILTSVLPPKFHGGTPRLLRWCRVLPELGWRVSLCGFSGQTHLLDQDSVPTGVDVTAVDVGRVVDRARAKAGVMRGQRGISGLVGGAASVLMGSSGDDFPDEYLRHMGRLKEAALTTIARLQPDVVMVTVPSFSFMQDKFLLALQSALPGRIVLDVRDMFSENDHWVGDHAAVEAASEWERQTAGLVDGVSGVSAGIQDHFVEATRADHSATVTNSYDRNHVIAPQSEWPGHSQHQFKLLFAGMASGAQAPKHLIPAVRLASKQDSQLPQHLRIIFAGLERDGAFGDWSEFGDVVERLGQVPYAMIPSLIAHSDALLLVIAERRRVDAVPGAKVFEYLGARRPILALTTGPAASLVKECHAGVTADPADPEACADALLALYRQWKSGQPWSFGDPRLVERFEVRNVAGDLIRLFERVMA